MDFSVNSLNKMESDVNSVLNQVLKIAKVESAGELTNDALMKMKFVVNLSKLAGKTIEVCKSAAGTIYDLKTEQLANQRRLFEAHQKQNKAVQQTVKTEMKSRSQEKSRYKLSDCNDSQKRRQICFRRRYPLQKYHCVRRTRFCH